MGGWFGSILIVAVLLLNAGNLIAASSGPEVAQAPSVAAHSASVPNGRASDDAHSARLLAYLTLVSIVVTAAATVFIALFNRQLVQVTKDMEKATSDAAEAAKQSAQAAESALHADRPFLLVVALNVETSGLGEFRDKNLTAKILLRNFGNGPADITDYIAQAELFDPPTQGRRDPVVIYTPHDSNRINDSLVAPAELVRNRLVATLAMTREEYASAFADEKRVGIHGRIRYRGSSKQIYETRFFWWYFADGGDTVRALTKELNDHT